MPELPEVETVREGVQRWIAGRRIASVQVLHPRAVRRHLAGAEDFSAQLSGLVVDRAERRGKYLWLPLRTVNSARSGAGDPALVAHLGMSGQLLVQRADAVASVHLRVRFAFADGGTELRFVDQRTFGGLVLDELVPAGAGADSVPSLVAHIARDPLDPCFDEVSWIARMRRSQSAVKRTLLDQTMVSGVGNIYADESLWRARLHGRRVAATLRPTDLIRLMADVREVFSESLTQGGTSFDALYVNVNGESGYFDRSLAVYGREGEPCRRCSTPVRREPFMNRSSYFCPRCQPAPRRPRGKSLATHRTGV